RFIHDHGEDVRGVKRDEQANEHRRPGRQKELKLLRGRCRLDNVHNVRWITHESASTLSLRPVSASSYGRKLRGGLRYQELRKNTQIVTVFLRSLTRDDEKIGKKAQRIAERRRRFHRVP